jgi:hypothetical protein
MTVSPTVSFDDIAARTEGFSGADLQALLYNCHLDIIHRSIQDAPTSETEPKDNEEIPVKYITIGGSGNKPLRSKAEETALQRRVCHGYESLCSSIHLLSPKLRQVLQSSSSQLKRQEEEKAISHKGVCTTLLEHSIILKFATGSNPAKRHSESFETDQTFCLCRRTTSFGKNVRNFNARAMLFVNHLSDIENLSLTGAGTCLSLLRQEESEVALLLDNWLYCSYARISKPYIKHIYNYIL